MDRQSESPELWAFLESLHPGDILSGTVAAIERFGVFVALDDRPAHPDFPGVGFIVIPELSWRHLYAPTDVVQVGQRVSCAFLQFDTIAVVVTEIELPTRRIFLPDRRPAGTKVPCRPHDNRRAQAVDVGSAQHRAQSTGRGHAWRHRLDLTGDHEVRNAGEALPPQRLELCHPRPRPAHGLHGGGRHPRG
ncbi:S1 RNA-binding domain-containing protein [Streptomyces sp. NPDC058486]|uniref:S1 RNA-binding domain-containing protein n=1 Tax=unclassified Streptomyces TaxID=2593676 RepID=UPI0036519A32